MSLHPFRHAITKEAPVATICWYQSDNNLFMKPRLHLYTRLNLPFILQLLMKMKTRGQLLLPTTDPSCCSINQDWNLKDQNFWLNILNCLPNRTESDRLPAPQKNTLGAFSTNDRWTAGPSANMLRAVYWSHIRRFWVQRIHAAFLIFILWSPELSFKLKSICELQSKKTCSRPHKLDLPLSSASSLSSFSLLKKRLEWIKLPG